MSLIYLVDEVLLLMCLCYAQGGCYTTASPNCLPISWLWGRGGGGDGRGVGAGRGGGGLIHVCTACLTSQRERRPVHPLTCLYAMLQFNCYGGSVIITSSTAI